MAEFSFACALRRPEPTVVVVELREGITSDSSPRLCETLHGLLKAGTSRLVVDLGCCDHLPSTGIGVLHFVLTKARKLGGDLYLANATDFIRDIMQATLGPNTCLSFATVHEAVNAFSDDDVREPIGNAMSSSGLIDIASLHPDLRNGNGQRAGDSTVPSDGALGTAAQGAASIGNEV